MRFGGVLGSFGEFWRRYTEPDLEGSFLALHSCASCRFRGPLEIHPETLQIHPSSFRKNSCPPIPAIPLLPTVSRREASPRDSQSKCTGSELTVWRAHSWGKGPALRAFRASQDVSVSTDGVPTVSTGQGRGLKVSKSSGKIVV